MTDDSNSDQKYELVCTDCAFTTEFEGDIDELYGIIEAHQERMQNSPDDHFVDFKVVSYSAVAPTDD